MAGDWRKSWQAGEGAGTMLRDGENCGRGSRRSEARGRAGVEGGAGKGGERIRAVGNEGPGDEGKKRRCWGERARRGGARGEILRGNF
eukprot:758541-Hanusia_phi.AAC.1